MDLKSYLKREELSMKDFSRLTGISERIVRLMTLGKYSVSQLEVILRLVELTNGEITFDDLIDKNQKKEIKKELKMRSDLWKKNR